jgi:hypothetical protein
MATVGQLPLLGYVNNVAVYGGCGAAGPTSYLLVWGGDMSKVSQAMLSTIKASHSSALFAIPGVQGHGIGACCVGSTNEACLHLYVSSNTSTVWDIATGLNVALAGESDCLGIVAEVPGKAAPRCDVNEPGCEPIPICNSTTSFDPTCCTVPKFDPGALRVPTLPQGSSLYGLELPQAAGECTHDGECVLNGCGNECVAYTAPSQISSCPCYPALKASFCGCVSGQCLWYEQQ